MGKRSRKRGGDVAAPPPPAARPARDSRPTRDREERPRAPWHPFPLVELCVLVGLILLIAGLIRWDDPGGREMLVGGMLLASLGGLDTALREHLAGYRSHTTVIASLPAVTTAAALYFARVAWPVLVIAAVAVFAGVFWWMRRVFMRRASRARRARG
jgi:hypothetical protein